MEKSSIQDLCMTYGLFLKIIFHGLECNIRNMINELIKIEICDNIMSSTWTIFSNVYEWLLSDST